MKSKIYCLKDIDGEVRYIGNTKMTLSQRLIKHVYEAKRIRYESKRCIWINECLEKGYRPIIEMLFEVEGDGYDEEKETIAVFKKMGFNLTNSTDGGLGCVNMKRSQETILKHSKAITGLKRTLEHRLRMSKIFNGKPFKCLQNNKIYHFVNDAAKDLGLHQGNISSCLRGERKSTGNCQFRYCTDEEVLNSEVTNVSSQKDSN